MRKKMAGFTLVELLIAMAIVGILVAVAYPSYLKQMQKSGRADAKVALNETAQRMQRCFTSSNTFKPAATGVCSVVDSAKSTAGIVSKEGFYVVKLVDDAAYTATAYVLQATPVSGKRQATDKECAKFSLSQTGIKLAFNSTNADTTTTCW